MNPAFLKRPCIKYFLFFPEKCCPLTVNKMQFRLFELKAPIVANQNILILRSYVPTKKNFISNYENNKYIEKSVAGVELKNIWNVPEVDKETLLKNFANLGNKEQSNDYSLQVLEYINGLPGISPDLRVASANLHFSKMRSDGIIITRSHYLNLLKCYFKSKYFGDVTEFLSEMESDGVELDEETKVLIIKCLAEAKLGKKISKIVKSGEEEKFSSKNKEECISSIIYSYGISGNLTGALEKFHKLKHEEYQPGSSVYTSLIRVFAIRGDKSKLEDLCNEALANELNFSEDEISSILRDLAMTQNFNLLNTVKLLCSNETLMKIGSELVIELVYQNEISCAFDLASNLLDLKYDDSISELIQYYNKIYKLLIQTLIKLNYPALDLLEKCKMLRKSKSSLFVFECLLYNYLIKGDMTNSLMTLREMLNENILIQSHYFWPLLVLAQKNFGDDGIVEILQTMNEMDSFINEETLINYVFPNISTLSFVSEILERTTFQPVQTEYIKEVFVKYALNNNLFKECSEFVMKNPLQLRKEWKFLKELSTLSVNNFPDEQHIYVILKNVEIIDPLEMLESLIWMKDTKNIPKIIKNLKENQLYVWDEKRAEEMFQVLRNKCDVIDVRELIEPVQETSLLNFTPHSGKRRKNQKVDSSKYSTMENLEKFEINMEELKTKNMPILRAGLRMIKEYMKEMMYSKALKVRNEIYAVHGTEFDLSPGYFMYFARMAAYENNVKSAMNYFLKLLSGAQRFQVNVPSALSLARLLIQNRHYDEMYKVLSAMPENIKAFETTEKECVHILLLVAALADPQKTNLVFNLLLKKNLISVTRNTTQASVATYIKANDLEGAVGEYFRIAEEHHMFTHKVSLLSALAEGKRFDLFDEISQISDISQFEKLQNMSNLIILAEIGDVNSLLKYAERFKINFNDKLLLEKFGQFHPTVTSCKTFIQAAKRKFQPYDAYVKTAINLIYKTRDYNEVEKFLNLCQDFKIELEDKTLTKLKNFDELGKIRKSSIIQIQ